MNSYELFVIEILPQLNKFTDFYKISRRYENKQVGDFFEIITKYIFILHYYYKNTTKNIWLYSEIPQPLFTELNIPAKDKGIDLVLQATDNKYYAIQSKYRGDKTETITWEDLGTFVGLTFGISNKFSGAYFVTNILTIDEEISKCDRVVKLYAEFFDLLDEQFFIQLKAYIKDHTIINICVPHCIRNYQNEFVNKCAAYFKENDRGYGNIACGLGKSLMAYWVYKKINPRITVIAVPSLYLLSQFFKEWSYESTADENNIEFLLVGSETDFDVNKFKNKNDHVSNGLLLTTDEIDIYAKLAVFKNYGKNNLVIITTYQSIDKLNFASNKLGLKYDFGIIDEAHKTCQQLGQQFSYILDNKNLSINKRLFLTATPRVYRTNSKDECPTDIASMDNKELYGEEIYRYNIRQGIDNNYLCQYQIMTLFTDDKYISNFINDNNLVSCKEIKETNSYYLSGALMIVKAFLEHDCRHLVTYHNKVSNCIVFQDILKILFKKYKLDVYITYLDGNTSMHMRKKLITSFAESERSILVTAKVLNEGVNIPIIDSVCFIDKRDSTIDIIQCIGRSLRLYDGKKMAKVLIPYLVTDVNELSNNDYFSKLLSVIKSLSDSDEIIKEYFRIKSKEKSINSIIRSECYLSDEIMVTLPDKIKISDWIDGINLEVWKRVDSFEYYYNRVIEWFKNNDKYPTRQSGNKTEIQIQVWLINKRKEKRAGKLSEHKIRKMEELPNFKWEMQYIFEEQFEELDKFVKENDRLPCKKNVDEKELAEWCKVIRQYNRLDRIDEIKKEKLETIKFWFWEKIDPFDDQYKQLSEWIILNKRFPRGNAEDPFERKMAHLATAFREKEREASLSDEKKHKLELITGWHWSDRNKKKYRDFQEKYDAIKIWIDKHNRIPVAKSNDSQESIVGGLCNRLRNAYKDNKLNDDQIKLFENISLWFWKADKIIKPFDETYEDLKKWMDINKRMPSKKSDDKEEKRLGCWCEKRKQFNREKKLIQEQIDKLNKLIYWKWNTRTK